jgi:hypothetical protein
MPRVLVVTDGPDEEIIMSEGVVPTHLDTEHARAQLVERLRWGVDDAVQIERRSRGTHRREARINQSYLNVGA